MNHVHDFPICRFCDDRTIEWIHRMEKRHKEEEKEAKKCDAMIKVFHKQAGLKEIRPGVFTSTNRSY